MSKLIELGANVNIQGETGQTALICSILQENEMNMNSLLDGNSKPNIQDHDGYTALMYLITCGWGSESVEKCINMGANLNLVNKNGHTVLMMAAAKGQKDYVKTLIEGGAHINQLSNKGTALMVAAVMGKVSCLKELIRAGADLSMRKDVEKKSFVIKSL